MGFKRPGATAAGLLVGLAAVGAWIPSLRMAGGEGSLGADVRVSAVVPPELGITTDPLLVNARRLVPRTTHNGDRGKTVLRNLTGQDVRVQVRVEPSEKALDDQMMLEMSARGHRFAVGTLAQLERGAPGFVIPRGGFSRLHVHTWLPASVRTGYQGLLQDVQLQLQVSAAHPQKAAA